MVTENEILATGNKMIRLLIRFFDTSMTKEELRQQFRDLLKNWQEVKQNGDIHR